MKTAFRSYTTVCKKYDMLRISCYRTRMEHHCFWRWYELSNILQAINPWRKLSCCGKIRCAQLDREAYKRDGEQPSQPMYPEVQLYNWWDRMLNFRRWFQSQHYAIFRLFTEHIGMVHHRQIRIKWYQPRASNYLRYGSYDVQRRITHKWILGPEI